MVGRHNILEQGDVSWQADAACKDADPNLFYPVGTTKPALKQIETAKAICRTCVVQIPCLEYALNNKEVNGIWGGTSEDERMQILRRKDSAWLSY